jgi:hypothetical protein
MDGRPGSFLGWHIPVTGFIRKMLSTGYLTPSPTEKGHHRQLVGLFGIRGPFMGGGIQNSRPWTESIPVVIPFAMRTIEIEWTTVPSAGTASYVISRCAMAPCNPSLRQSTGTYTRRSVGWRMGAPLVCPDCVCMARRLSNGLESGAWSTACVGKRISPISATDSHGSSGKFEPRP